MKTKIPQGYRFVELPNEEFQKLWGDYYAGKILEYHPEGVSICRWPVYRHSVPVASGMSGGPLLHKANKKAIAVNCTGDSTNSGDVEHGTGTDIICALDLVISAPIPNFQGKTLRELLQAEGVLS